MNEKSKFPNPVQKVEDKDLGFINLEDPDRKKVGDIFVGCPPAHNEAPCHMCGGNWPGTRSNSQDIIDAIQ